jgi:hypothetical protein
MADTDPFRQAACFDHHGTAGAAAREHAPTASGHKRSPWSGLYRWGRCRAMDNAAPRC